MRIIFSMFSISSILSVFALLIVALLFTVNSVFAGQRRHPQFEIEIASTDSTHPDGVIQGTTTTVSIDLTGSDPIGGFDFLVTYDASILTVLNALPGEALTNDAGGLEEFEYFTYRFIDNCGDGCPTGILRIVGMRESNDGIVNTNAYVYNGTLANINFHVSSDLSLECQIVPIRFYWRDCGDNTLSDLTGDFLYLANQVIDPEWGSIIDDGDFGYYGPASDCFEVEQDENVAIQSAIAFTSGFIKIICITDIDNTGDINLNGIDYEVADAVVFTNYFIIGLDAFTINVDGQTAATDVNRDGVPLTVEDLVHLIRVIIGNALPYSDVKPVEHFSGTLQIQNDGNAVTVGGMFKKDIGAIHLCLYVPGQINNVSLSIRCCQSYDYYICA